MLHSNPSCQLSDIFLTEERWPGNYSRLLYHKIFEPGQVVLEVGFEPTRPFGHRCLRPERLPSSATRAIHLLHSVEQLGGYAVQQVGSGNQNLGSRNQFGYLPGYG